MKNGDMPIAAIVNENGAPMHYNEVGIRDGCLTGLTKREYFAAMAMQGILSTDTEEWQGTPDNNAKAAVRMADALLSALEDK